MKTFLTLSALFVCVIVTAQTNKFEAGDFGVRYGVSFNGTATQTLTFLGMVNDRIEVGCGINVQYTKSNNTTTQTTEIQFDSSGTLTDIPAPETYNNSSMTINTSLSPYVFYHFKIKNNLDIYTGPGIIIGTGSHTFSSTSSQITQVVGYYHENFSKTIYPLGYQVGGALNIGGQYFFYKRLALGVQASVGVTYSNIDGTEKVINKITNSGANNSSTQETNTVVSGPYIGRSLSFSTATSIGINLTFYMSRKVKVKKEAKTM